ncbi:MAG: metallophosphoesterase [Bacteroidales bacterium]|nr:metallophosphoesterase [Bacteroidales bacterium]MBN2632785.1 metallophosphoesterase [Bacteroidales bacterium]
MIFTVLILLIIDILTFLVIRDRWFRRRESVFCIILITHIILSLAIWLLLARNHFFNGDFDTPSNIRNHMNFTGMLIGVVIPRTILVLFHYTGRLFRLRRGGYSAGLTGTGFILAAIIFIVVAVSTISGRFNFSVENVDVRIKGLDNRLEGLRIVHISDLHLASYDNHKKRLEEVVAIVNDCKPDLIINTGDFISYGWREYDSCDTILAKAVSRYGNLAVLGNHDMGTYFPGANESTREEIVKKVSDYIRASGYRLIDNENIRLLINGAEVACIGVSTAGRYPGIVHYDIGAAAEGTDSAALRMLLIHDPNQWRRDVCDKTDIELSFAGHTHGLQAGIITKRFRWSPAKYIYPEWGGLYNDGDQYLYVNRGLGFVGFPFRVWMPPEITVLTLSSE